MLERLRLLRSRGHQNRSANTHVKWEAPRAGTASSSMRQTEAALEVEGVLQPTWRTYEASSGMRSWHEAAGPPEAALEVGTLEQPTWHTYKA